MIDNNRNRYHDFNIRTRIGTTLKGHLRVIGLYRKVIGGLQVYKACLSA
jgi:hypothetical protein